MLHISSLSKSFGGQQVLADVTFAVAPGEKTALVGRNGCGKTTLLRIICGEEDADSGDIVLGPSCQLGYLHQEGQLDPSRTLYEEMLEVFASTKQLEQELRTLEEQMSAESDEIKLKSLMSRYANVQNRYDTADPHLIDAKINIVLNGMGFSTSDLPRHCREFSGGWQMRGAMAKLLLREPDLLLLDEPTNHLDVATVEWLENYLKKSSSAVLLVSHDRVFLDNLIKRTLELRNGVINDYAGNYSYYLEEREVRRALQQAAYENQQKQIAKDMEFVERFRYKATLATRVQSRIKLMEKRELIDAPDRDKRSMKADFQTATPSGHEALTINKVSKAYGSRQVLDSFSMEVKRGDRIALIGANGVGKSTLLRLLAGTEKQDSGTIKCGYKVVPVYYAQHQAEALDMTRTVLEEAADAAPRGVDQTRIRTILGCLLFEGDDVNKSVSVLSGGERSRLALARCILTPSNLLLLDEPTNHLDINSREALLEALSDYPGTIILVTHDRFFMNELATCVVEIRGGKAFRYIGSYDDYHRKREIEKKEEQAREKAELEKKKASAKPHTVKVKASGNPKPIRWKLEALEKRIFELEDELKALSEELADPKLYSDPALSSAKRARYEKCQAEVTELTAIWEEMA